MESILLLTLQSCDQVYWEQYRCRLSDHSGLLSAAPLEEGREGDREGGREEGREGGREGGRVGGREEGREMEREEGNGERESKSKVSIIYSLVSHG